MKQYTLRIGTAGFAGVAYLPSKPPQKAVIVVTGSDGGTENAAYLAQKFARQGFFAVAVGYFGAAGLRRSIREVPLEYIRHAICWIRRHGGGAVQEIAGVGFSKGAEYMLLAATVYHEITAVAALVPNFFVGEGVQRGLPPYTGTSSWTYRGKPVPYTPLARSFGRFSACTLVEGQPCVKVFYEGANVRAESHIAVEQSRARILLFSAEDDAMWPSKCACEKLVQRLACAKHPHSFRHICFEKGSHLLSAMPEEKAKQMGRVMRAERSWPQGCRQARRAVFAEAVGWFGGGGCEVD